MPKSNKQTVLEVFPKAKAEPIKMLGETHGALTRATHRSEYRIRFINKTLGKGKSERDVWKDAVDKMRWNKTRIDDHCADLIQIALSKVKLNMKL